jgi:hypothetical protein
MERAAIGLALTIILHWVRVQVWGPGRTLLGCGEPNVTPGSGSGRGRTRSSACWAHEPSTPMGTLLAVGETSPSSLDVSPPSPAFTAAGLRCGAWGHTAQSDQDALCGYRARCHSQLPTTDSIRSTSPTLKSFAYRGVSGEGKRRPWLLHQRVPLMSPCPCCLLQRSYISPACRR